MVSFLGLYMAAVYAPVGRFLDHHPATSWLLSFYLPHFYRSQVGPLNVGTYLLAGILVWFAGLWVFFYSALQVYGTKLTGGQAVDRGFYRWVRHPQYLAFMALPVPFLVIWPRYLLMGMYVALVVFYVNLAFKEEQECLSKYGEAYRRYQAGTAMFLPGLRIERLLDSLPIRIPKNAVFRGLSVTALAAAAAAVSLVVATSLAKAWAGGIPQIRETSSLWVPIFHHDREKLAVVRRTAERDRPLQETLQELRAGGARSFYVLMIPWGEAHFFIDYKGCLCPQQQWNGVSTEDYWVSLHSLETPHKDFRSLLFFASEEPLPEGEHVLFSLLRQAGRWRPRYMVGIDLAAEQVVSHVLLKKASHASCSTLRLPLL